MKKDDAVWRGDDDERPKMFSGPEQTCSEKTATSLKRESFVAYPVNLLELRLNAKTSRYSTDQEQTLIGSFPARREEVEIETVAAALEEYVSR